jgi:hypothetical protein
MARFASELLMPMLENEEQPGRSGENTTGNRRIGSGIVLVVGRHIALPRGLGRFPKRTLRIEQSFAAELIPRSGHFTDLGALQR